MSTQFRRSFEESNPMKKQVIEQWLLENVDDSQQGKQHVICFLNATSFYQTSLLDTRKWQPEFKDRVLLAIGDRDMKEDLVKCGLINWCRNVSSMIPVTVPKDGNCLLHSVAMAVWGISDTSLMFRRLLCLALGVDKDQRFRSRWLHDRQRQISQFVDRLLETKVELMDKEWQEISQCLEPDRSQSVAVPHRFLESIHVYALANILRRPIIVLTDSSVRTYSGLNLQDNDMGGIYLPLEWNWTDTCHSPIFLGYSQSHFCPLLFAGYPNQTLMEARPQRNLAPLVNSKFEQFPVRFLLQGEEPEVGHLLGKYLRVRETVTQVNGRVQNVLCADVEVKSMPENLDIVADYVQNCVQRFQQEKKSLTTSQHLPSASPSPQAGVSVKQKHQPQGLPHNVRREQLQGVQPPEYALGDPALHTTGLGQPQINIPPPSFLPRRSLDEQSMSLNAPPDKKCVVPTCKYYGDPCLAMMCSSCFKNYSIRESKKPATAAARPSPSAPLASIPAQEARFPISMMNEKCKEKCGFFCSTKTFPYCHECAGKRQRQSQEKTMAAALGLAMASNEREKSPALFSSGLGPQEPEESREVSGKTTMKMTSSAQGASSAGQLPTGGAPSDRVEADPQLQKTSPPPLSTTQMMDENWTQAMVTGELPCPEPGTEDPSSQQLFGSGETSAMSSIHAGQAGSATVGEPQVTPSTGITAPASAGAQLLPELQDPDLVTPASGMAPVLSEPEAGDVGQTTQQTSSSVLDRQEHQLNASGQDISSAASLAKSLMSPTSLAGAGGDAEAVCTNQGCNEPVLHKSLCGKCYVGQDLKGGEPVSLTEEETKMMSIHSTSSSAPASVGPAANIPRSNATFTKEAGIFSLPESRSQPSSLRDLRNIPPMNYTQSWIHDNQFAASPLTRNVQAQSGPNSPPQGLPEKPESEPLGNDLIASGAGCFSSTQHCIGDGCGNAVPQAGMLCQQCQDILRQARQASGASASGQAVQERPEQPQCRTARCSFYGIPENFGYCTKCYGKHVEREIQLKSHHSTPACSIQSPSSAPRSPHIIVPPDFNYVCTPSEQQGQLCVAAGCRLFGDPKMAGMCYSHYQQHCRSIAKATHNMPAASKRRNVTSVTYAPEVFITPSSVTIFRSGGDFPPPQVSVPPPPFPTGTGVPSIPKEPSLGETYYRVAGHPMGKCLNPACSNYGNHSKGGLCNSCANDQRVTDDLISRAILGDEEVG